MSRPLQAAAIALALFACAKPAANPAAGEEQTGPKPPPKGFDHVGPPPGFRSLRPLSSTILPDGTLAIAGSAVKLIQYQWLLRAPTTGEAAQSVFDPGRVEWIAHNGTAGLDAVGTLGGVPEDKAWYGDIDAFGKLGTRQTYLSDGSGQLRSVVRVDGGLVAAGEMFGPEARLQGWVVRTDHNGRDEWKTAVGASEAQSLGWVGEQGGTYVAVGWQLHATEDPWVVAIDASGGVALDKHWDEPGWTRLRSAVLLPGGDLLALGLSAPTQAGELDGIGSLWITRVSGDGTSLWDRAERSDLSAVSRVSRWGNGVAVACLRGAVGTPREVLVARISEDGETRWIEPDLPAGVDWAEIQVAEEKLWLVAAIAHEGGIAWKRIHLEGSNAP